MFCKICDFPAWTIYLPIGTIFEAEMFTVDTTFRALQDEILFNQFGEYMWFLWEKPHGIGHKSKIVSNCKFKVIELIFE